MCLHNKNCKTLTGCNSMNWYRIFKSWGCLTIYMNWAVQNCYNIWFFVLNSMCNLRLKIINFCKILEHPKFRGSKRGQNLVRRYFFCLYHDRLYLNIIYMNLYHHLSTGSCVSNGLSQNGGCSAISLIWTIYLYTSYWQP